MKWADPLNRIDFHLETTSDLVALMAPLVPQQQRKVHQTHNCFFGTGSAAGDEFGIEKNERKGRNKLEKKGPAAADLKNNRRNAQWKHLTEKKS